MMISVDYWHWWVTGVILLSLEMVMPGAFFLWIGISAVITGFLKLGAVLSHLPLPFDKQLIIFAVLSVASLVTGRKFLKREHKDAPDNNLNRRGLNYIGRTVTLSAPIIDGRGHIKVDDILWTVKGPDCPANIQVRIIEVDGALLIVEPLAEKA